MCLQHQDEFSSVMVILCDYKLRKFQRRLLVPDEVVVTKMSAIEEALYRSKTKLNAALARSRIKSRVLSIDWLLPDSVRKNDKIGNRMHVTCWVNFVKTRSYTAHKHTSACVVLFKNCRSFRLLVGISSDSSRQPHSGLSFQTQLVSFSRISHHVLPLIMVALWNRADHYIFMLLFVLSPFFFFPRLISAAADWMSAILPHMVWS